MRPKSAHCILVGFAIIEAGYLRGESPVRRHCENSASNAAILAAIKSMKEIVDAQETDRCEHLQHVSMLPHPAPFVAVLKVAYHEEQHFPCLPFILFGKLGRFDDLLQVGKC